MRLHLAKVPCDSVQDLEVWQLFAGKGEAGADIWSGDMEMRQPVLTDERCAYKKVHPLFYGSANMSVISRGSVTFNVPLKRYIYASWTEYTFELYESPSPSGPFKLFYAKDFGGYFWNSEKGGGYATTIPSKFTSEDGKTMWVVSSTFAGGAKEYFFGIRKLVVEPFAEGCDAQNVSSGENLAQLPDAVVFNACNHRGNGESGRDGDLQTGGDSWTCEVRTEDFWGYTFASQYAFQSSKIRL